MAEESLNDTVSQAVIRHLPPSMTASEFISAVDPLPDHNYFWFEEADTSLGQHAFSRAYISFKERNDIDLFTDKFDGYVFVDSKGNEFPASVEFAPFQKIPKVRIVASETKPRVTSRDPKVGTIEEDPEYVAFLESLEESRTECNLPSAEIYLEEMEKKAKELKDNHGCPKVLTPLLEYVLNKKSENRPIQEAKNPRRGRREEKSGKEKGEEKGRKEKGEKGGKEKAEKGGKEKGELTQERLKTKSDPKLSRKDRRRERDRKEGEGSGGQKTVEKPKESIRLKNEGIRLLKNENRNLGTNKDGTNKDLTKDLSRHTDSRTSSTDPTNRHSDSRTSSTDPTKALTGDSSLSVKSVDNERPETDLKKTTTGKSHESSSPPSKARRDERRGDERRGDERRGDERKRNDRRDVKKDVNRDGKREEKREKKQDRDRKKEGNREVKREGNIEKREDKTQEKRELKNVERKDESRKEEGKDESRKEERKDESKKEEAGEGRKENVGVARSSPEGRKSSSDKRDRVRNKDRPDIPRYQPRVRSDPSHGDCDGDDRRDPASSGQGSRKVRTKVFTRTRKTEN